MNRNQTEANAHQANTTDVTSRINWFELDNSPSKLATFVDDDSLEPDVIKNCLSAEERQKATTFPDQTEKRHFIMRRAFQRAFIKSITQTPVLMEDLPLLHQTDRPPTYVSSPQTSLSFSSSGKIAIACASNIAKIGVDIEKIRLVSNALELSRRFFHPVETNDLASLPADQCELQFLKYWTIKEACLKAIGKGVVYGPEKFIISTKSEIYTVDPPAEFGSNENWRVDVVNLYPNYLITVVHCNFT
jgi:4'-phosphopantetheinyl transferase